MPIKCAPRRLSGLALGLAVVTLGACSQTRTYNTVDIGSSHNALTPYGLSQTAISFFGGASTIQPESLFPDITSNGGGAGGGGGGGATPTPVQAQSSSRRGLSLHTQTQLAAGFNILSKAGIYQENSHFFLPEGVVLSNGTRLIDPMTVQFQSGQADLELGLGYIQDFGHLRTSLSASRGVTIGTVQTSINSALIRTQTNAHTQEAYRSVEAKLGYITSEKQPGPFMGIGLKDYENGNRIAHIGVHVPF